MAVPIPIGLSRGWTLEDNPPPQLDRKFSMCKAATSPLPPHLPIGEKPQPACDMKCYHHKVATKKGFFASRPVNASAACERCECQLCSICSKPANRWTSPTGQTIDTVTTRTEPRFTFAYNPYDDDMARMRKTMILEPMLTHAWHEATAQCCRDKRGLVIDVGGNFGWYTLYSLALGCHVVVFEPVPAYREV